MSNLTLNVMTDADPGSRRRRSQAARLPGLASLYVVSLRSAIGDYCFGGVPGDDFWSVSQATPVRSVIINGNLNFQSYCSETNYQANNYGSGSYVANSEINGQLDWSGNQQGIARNSDFESAAGYVWNYVYSGDACPPGYTPAAPTVPTRASANARRRLRSDRRCLQRYMPHRADPPRPSHRRQATSATARTGSTASTRSRSYRKAP